MKDHSTSEVSRMDDALETLRIFSLLPQINSSFAVLINKRVAGPSFMIAYLIPADWK